MTRVALSVLLMSHLLQFSHSTQVESAILIKLCSFCDCKNHRERRTSNTVCMKSTSRLEPMRDKMPVQLKCEASQPLLSFLFFFLNLIHITLDACFLKKLRVLSCQIIVITFTNQIQQNHSSSSQFSQLPLICSNRERMLYQETSTPVPIHTYNTPTRCQCQFNPDSHLND